MALIVGALAILPACSIVARRGPAAAHGPSAVRPVTD